MDFPVVGVVGLCFVLKGFEGGWDRVATVAEVALHAGGQTFPVQLSERAIRPVREEESVGVEVRGVTGDTPIVRHPKLVEGFLGDVLTITLAKLPLKFILEGCVVLHVIWERVGIEIMRGKPGESWAGKMRAGEENLLFLGVEFSGIGAEMHLQDSLPSVESAPGFASELFRVPEFERFGFARREWTSGVTPRPIWAAAEIPSTIASLNPARKSWSRDVTGGVIGRGVTGSRAPNIGKFGSRGSKRGT